MLPIVIDVSRIRIALVGEGERAERRLGLLESAGALLVSRFHSSVAPETIDFGHYTLVYVAGCDSETSGRIARQARAKGCLLNVEDTTDLCDFHSPAVVRRGPLVLSVSTDGLVPGLAGVIAEYLGRIFPPVWATRMAFLAAKRRSLHALDATHRDIREAFRHELQRRNWVPALPAPSNSHKELGNPTRGPLITASVDGGAAPRRE